VINEIHYHPPLGQDEFIELKSVTNGVVKLFDPLYATNTWRLSGVGFNFPTNSEIPPNGLVLLVSTDPNLFRSRYSVPANVPIFGPYSGLLQGGGETLALQYADQPDLDTNTGKIFIPYVDVDVVRYNDKAPWPTNADGFGSSLERLNPAAYGNDPINWRASPGAPSPGLDNTGNRPPQANAGLDQDLTATTFPVAVALAGTASDDRLPNPPGTLSLFWSQLSGPATVWFDNASQAATTAHFPGSGTYVLRLTASDGVLQAQDELTIAIQRPVSGAPITLQSKGAVWKYLDDGSDQGTAWVAPEFNDNAWKSGPAPLGYGDADRQAPATTVGYGPSSGSKYITTYFRRTFAIDNPKALTNLVVSLQRDDGAIIYLNGRGIFTNNMPAGPIDFLSTAPIAIGGTDETSFFSQPVDSTLLVSGNNVLAAEIHQSGPTSSDIIFDLELTADTFAANQSPAVNAGPDQAVTLPGTVVLNATVSDDGLPIPPGLLTFTWTKVSGPGNVAFANPAAINTTATFSAPGGYVLRLTASDGAASVADDLTVTANGQESSPAQINTVEFFGGTSPMLNIAFTAEAGRTYTVQYRNSLIAGTWSKLQDVPEQNTRREVQVPDQAVSSSSTRFYRIVSPQQP
jgi:hypothetical protein